MDAHDIFLKLTRGVHFTKKRQKITNSNPTPKNEVLIPQKIVESNEILKSETEDDCKENQPEDSFKFLKDDTTIDYYYECDEAKKEKLQKPKNNPEAKKQMLAQEELNQFRNTNRISVQGSNIPPPIKTFDELSKDFNVPKNVLDNLGSCGFPLPTPVQMQAIPIMLKGRSLMACAPTGSGKTLAFLLPIIRDLNGPQKNGFRAIILCPTRELAKQTQRECLRLTEKTGLKSHVISKIHQVEQKFGPNSNKKYDILVSTPNRIKYLLQQDPPILDLSNIEWFLIDEADKLMEDGQNSFKEQFQSILNACTKTNKKLALFSATYTAPVAKWASRNLKGLIKVTIGERNSATDLVNQELLFVGSESGKLLAIRDLVRTGLKPPVLVFVQSKDRAKQLFGELLYDGINVDVIHADRTQQQRDNVVRAFREGKIWVLICTELMGRGIDFKGVNLVINYDFPPTAISYIHRIGRTGRAGRPGKAITYFTQDDTANLRSIAHIIKNSGGNVPEFMLTLKKPKKSEKKKLANFAPEREDIITVPKFVLEKRKQLKESAEEKNAREDNEPTVKRKINKNEKNIKKNQFIKNGGKVNRLKVKQKLNKKNK